jgi:hypothetical protein
VATGICTEAQLAVNKLNTTFNHIWNAKGIFHVYKRGKVKLVNSY